MQHVKWIVPVLVYILNRLGGPPEADVDKRGTISPCNGKPTQPRHLSCMIEHDCLRTRASFISKDMERGKEVKPKEREATNWCKKILCRYHRASRSRIRSLDRDNAPRNMTACQRTSAQCRRAHAAGRHSTARCSLASWFAHRKSATL
jgi:hypothetical protein